MSSDNVSIFVSRILDSNSDLNLFSESIAADLTAFSLIEFTALPFPTPLEDWLFFYSKSGVRYFFKQLASEVDFNRYQFASFGSATGKFIESLIGRPVDFCGDADALTVSSSLAELIGEASICFVVGQQSLRSVQSLITYSSEIIVYDNQPLTTASLRHYDIAIITSPMNAVTFIKSGGSADHYISIGATTSEAMMQLGLIPTQAPHPSELGLNIILKSVYKDYYYGETK